MSVRSLGPPAPTDRNDAVAFEALVDLEPGGAALLIGQRAMVYLATDCAPTDIPSR